MESAAKLITAIGTLLGAIAWPLAIFTLGFVFRNELRFAARRVPSFMDRVRKMKIAGIEAELDRVADAVEENKKGTVTPRQIEIAAKIAIEADNDLDLAKQIDRLCLEYDSIRLSMPAGNDRTQAMTRVIVRMRALAPTLVGFIENYKGSGSPGSRLAAIAMMQMSPNACDINWLADRFSVEQPFVFYHAALALQNMANNSLSNVEWDQLLGAVQRSLDDVRKFSGSPDQSTIEVLELIMSDIRS